MGSLEMTIAEKNSHNPNTCGFGVARKLESLEHGIRSALDDAIKAGWSVSAIAEECDVSQPSLNKFVAGKSDNMMLSTAAPICEWLQMELSRPIIPPPDPERKAGRPSK